MLHVTCKVGELLRAAATDVTDSKQQAQQREKEKRGKEQQK